MWAEGNLNTSWGSFHLWSVSGMLTRVYFKRKTQRKNVALQNRTRRQGLFQDHYPTMVVKGVKVRLPKEPSKAGKTTKWKGPLQSTHVNLVDEPIPKPPQKMLEICINNK